ncbi:enoyl-CoA hydratase/isomerase family protein [Evansella sp. AB-P1]|uniref:enoyl-CoA hydratase/isomerase family protein n=1 Tax=Evansella sp. AB-P1 TaxID=3037653 RepID=UPI00241C0003|nr:enoyl-CoA hydratase/isomerase family protein [Evansella sp. AB-P1]MDG5787393.1 enoyl-CoA hydratase/isomerase family protein [Evansella sp. AB-P1]
MYSNKTVSYTVSNEVATITMNRPQVKNAINLHMHEELYAAFHAAEQDDQVKVIVLTGKDGSFSSGADLKSIPLDQMSSFDHGTYLEQTYNPLILLIDRMEKPTVAYLNGTAVGAGLSLALACDFRVGDPDAKLALSFLKIGLIPDAGASYFLPRLVGLGKALELSLGSSITAEEALRIGLINQLGDPTSFIESLKNVSQPAYSLMKKNMKTGFQQSLEDVLHMEVLGQRESGKSPHHQQAIRTFIKGH